MRRLLVALTMGAALGTTTTAQAQSTVTFLEVALDEETRTADEKLRRYLAERTGITFVPERPLEYDAAVNRLVAWRSDRGHYLARMTPYALVAAEMLGAHFEGLATYVSTSTGQTTYHAYFVVSREAFQREPDLAGLVEYLRSLGRPASFVYHSKFSTSSYFLPALFFRDHGIYHMPQPTARHLAIHSRQFGSSSSDLVRAVAQGRFDLAAVWDATKRRFEETDTLFARYGRHVHFIQLPTPIPNDLLVISSPTDTILRERIDRAILEMGPEEIGEGDFRTWAGLARAPTAREALSNLRWLARERNAPVTVAVQRAGGGTTAETLDAVRQAVRLSSTELVNFDEDYHAHPDYLWSLEEVRPGSVSLTSRISGSDVEDQRFRINFRDSDDLIRQVAALVHTRLHRIRYVWGYRPERPTIIRDLDFSLPEGSAVRVRRIHWLDSQRNYFRQEAEFVANVESADFYKLELAPNFIAAGEGGFGFDPMSNIAYRVVLLREVQEPLRYRILTVLLLVLLVGGGVAAASSLRRTRGADLPTAP